MIRPLVYFYLIAEIGNTCGWIEAECCSKITLTLDDEIKEAYGAFECRYSLSQSTINDMPLWTCWNNEQFQMNFIWYKAPTYGNEGTWNFGVNPGGGYPTGDITVKIPSETTDICPTNEEANWVGNSQDISQYVHLECKDFYINVCKKITTLSTLEL